MTEPKGIPGLAVPGSDEQLRQMRARYATLSAGERLDTMLTEITLGVPKDRSVAVITAADSDRWDRLARDVRKIKDRGGEVVGDISAREDV